jgi:hypothetical protein
MQQAARARAGTNLRLVFHRRVAILALQCSPCRSRIRAQSQMALKQNRILKMRSYSRQDAYAYDSSSSELPFLLAFSASACLRQPLLRQLSTGKRMTGDSKQLTHYANPQLAAEPMRLMPDRGRPCSRRSAAYLQLSSAIFSYLQHLTVYRTRSPDGLSRHRRPVDAD